MEIQELCYYESIDINLINNLIDEIDQEFDRYSEFNAKQIITIFLKIIKYNKINAIIEALEIRYIENKFDKFQLARKDLTNSIEAYFKDIYELIDGCCFQGTMSDCLGRFFNDVDTNFWTNNRSLFLTSKRNPNPQRDPTFFAGLTFLGDKIKLVYDLRNAITHSNHEIRYPSKSKNLSNQAECVNDIKDCICVYLYITYQYNEQIIECLNADKGYDFIPYLNQVKGSFRQRIQKYVHLDSQEDLGLSQSYVIEHRDLRESEELTERRGTVDDLRKNHIPEKRMILWGEAGMGKTTTLEYLAFQDAEICIHDKQANIPVYIALGLTTDKNISLKQNIFNKIGVDAEIGEAYLRNGKINLFLDAVNEIPQDDNNQLRTYRQREIENLIKNYPNTFIIITNRPQENNIFLNVPIFVLQKMDDGQINIFLEKNSGSLKTQNQIQTAIEQNPRLKSIIKTPFMLSRLVQVVKSNGHIPTNKGDIIHEFIQSLYRREQVEKKDANFNLKVIHRLLRYLGYQSLEQKGTNAGLSEDYILNKFADSRNKYGFQINLVYVLEISTQLGILEKHGNLYTFSHQEYQDYYYFEEAKSISEN